MDAMVHQPVMLDEVMHGLNVKQQGKYIDCTFGRGGHSGAILDRLGSEGRLLSLDKDPDAMAASEAQRFSQDRRCHLMQADFRDLAVIAGGYDWTGKVDGILMDLGVSSPQLDAPERGFAFLHDGPLDMRMNPDRGVSVSDWLAQAAEREIADVIYRFGEERYARRIAHTIVSERDREPLTTTRQLAGLVERCIPRREHHKHPATRTFQALRIHINQELEALESALNQGVELLSPGGRLVVIAFHSLEDRIVKRFIRTESRGEPLPRGLPVIEKERHVRLVALGKKRPSALEVSTNPRARSAVLRIAQRR